MTKLIIQYHIQPFLLRFEINKWRLIYLAFGIAAFLIAYSTGAAVPMSEEEAQTLTREFSKQIEGIDQNGIFLNNIRITLIMFVPAVATGVLFVAAVIEWQMIEQLGGLDASIAIDPVVES
jgi:hypothetical protein